MARKTKAEAARTRKRILRAALSLFAEKGYEQTTLDDVAWRIRMTKGAVYWHFKNKPDLLGALVADMTENHAGGLGRALAEPDSFDTLRDHLVGRARFVTDTPANSKFFKVMTRLDWMTARVAPVKRRIQQLETGIFAVISRTLNRLKASGEVRTEVDVTLVAELLGGLWLGLLKIQTDACMEHDLSTVMATGIDMVFKTIKR